MVKTWSFFFVCVWDQNEGNNDCYHLSLNIIEKFGLKKQENAY